MSKKMVVREISDEVYEGVVTDLESMVVQETKNWREVQMRVYWQTGEVLREAERDNGVNITRLVQRLATDNRMKQRQMSDRTLWLCVKFFDEYKEFEKVYDTELGENISWPKIRKLLLPPAKPKEPSIEDIAQRLFNKLGVDGTLDLVKELKRIIKATGANESD